MSAKCDSITAATNPPANTRPDDTR